MQLWIAIIKQQKKIGTGATSHQSIKLVCQKPAAKYFFIHKAATHILRLKNVYDDEGDYDGQ